MLTLWGRESSTNVKKARWCAAELNLNYTHINAGGSYGKLNDAAYRSLNPNGLIPLLQDGNFVLWESNTIVRYLAAKFGNDPFYPQELQRRAAAEKWMDWVTSTLVPPFRTLFIGMVRTQPEQRDYVGIDAAIIELEQHFDIIEQTLAHQSYLSGETFGIGDIPLGSFIYAWFTLSIERRPRPHLERWYQQLCTRPAYQTTVMLPLV